LPDAYLAESAENGNQCEQEREDHAYVDIVVGLAHRIHTFDYARGDLQHGKLGLFGVSLVPNGAANWEG